MRTSPSVGLLLVFFSCLVCINVYSQSSFLLLGGQEFEGKLLSEQAEYLSCEIEKKNGKLKTIDIDIDRVFSVTTDGKEVIYYKRDPTEGKMYTAQEMRFYIYGQQDARANHKVVVPVVVAASVSTALAFAFAQEDNALLITAPIIGSVIGGLTQNNRPKVKNARNPEILSHPTYVAGYKKTARGKKIIRSIIAAAAGAVAGAVSGTIIANN